MHSSTTSREQKKIQQIEALFHKLEHQGKPTSKKTLTRPTWDNIEDFTESDLDGEFTTENDLALPELEIEVVLSDDQAQNLATPTKRQKVEEDSWYQCNESSTQITCCEVEHEVKESQMQWLKQYQNYELQKNKMQDDQHLQEIYILKLNSRPIKDHDLIIAELREQAKEEAIRNEKEEMSFEQKVNLLPLKQRIKAIYKAPKALLTQETQEVGNL